MSTTRWLVTAALLLAGCGDEDTTAATRLCLDATKNVPFTERGDALSSCHDRAKAMIKADREREEFKVKHPECWARAYRDVPSTEANDFFDKCVAGKT